ncbi:MAG: glycosyltransferase family 39 protein, partial [Tepidisphaeraceae bacterium]
MALAVSLLLRLVAMHSVVLIPEEAYYWMYAQHPSMSYFDHPPMVAWIIRAGTLVFGDTEFGVRIVGSLLMCAASALLYLYGRMWYSHRAGLIAAAALLVLPVYFGAGFIATMDSPLVLFWIACLLGVSIALRNDRAAGWYLAGAAMGAAMLSKYTGVFLALGGVLAVVGCRPYRRHLLTVHPYLAALLALAIFSPVIVWNAQHDWASFRFQFMDRFAGNRLSWETPPQFVVMQFAVATPILLIGMLWL